MHKFEKKYQIWFYNGFSSWILSEEFNTIEEAISYITRENYGGNEWAITSRVDFEIKERGELKP